MIGTNGVYFSPESYWSGINLNVPGSGTTPVLARTGPGTLGDPPTGGPWTILTTNRHWRFSCVTTITGGTGQGFLALGPDGTTYRFDQMVTFPERPRKSTEIRVVGGMQVRASGVLAVRQYRLYPTRVVDRFGNGVTYTWSGDRLLSIVGDDGRTLTFSHEASNPVTGRPRRITSVSDGTRSVSYTYAAPSQRLTTVTLPGHTTASPNQWTIDSAGVEALVRYVTLTGDASSWDIPMSCQAMRKLSTTQSALTMTHPSGATASFQMGFRRYWRTNRDTSTSACQAIMGYEGEGNPPQPDPIRDNKPWDNARFDTLAVLTKTITGNLLTAAQWQFARLDQYSFPAPGGGDWPINGTRTVTETRPDGSQLISVFGTDWLANEGQLLSTRVMASAGGVELTRTDMTYVQTAEISPTGFPFPDRVGDSLNWEFQPPRTAFTRPLKVRRTNQQGVDFVWQATAFDAMARPTTVNRRSETPGATPVTRHARTDITTWMDDTSPWVLGQQVEVYSADLQRTLEYRIYHPDRVLPTKIFGEGVRTAPDGSGLPLFQEVEYDTAGRVAWVKDGRGNKTSVGNWNRGIPQTITYADLKTRLATVNGLGQVTQVTDQNGFVTGFAYDGRGLVSQVSYPTGDTVAWNATTQVFEKITVAEYGLPVGTWRQTVSTGNGRKVTWFDALWRPILTREYDTANPVGTQRFNASAYDADGRQIFVAYPRATITSLASFTEGTDTIFDGLGRPTSVTRDSELGVTGLLTSLTEYISDFRVRTTNPRGKATVTSFQAFDQPDTGAPTLIDAPASQLTRITRDVLGRAVEMRRGIAPALTAPVVRSYAYDLNGQLCQINEPETGSTVLQYDAAGNLSWSAAGLNLALPTAAGCGTNRTSAYASGRRVNRTYDGLNRLLTLSFPNGIGNQTWTYTADGLPETIRTLNNSSGGEIVDNAYVYNRRRMLTGETSAQPGAYSWSVGYGYDANGSLASMVYPSTLTIAYAPNALGQPTQAGTFATGVQYYPNGAVKQFTYGNGIVHTMTQNARLLPARSTDSGGVIDLTYTFDSNGNNDVIGDQLDSNRSRWMTYDDLDRLTDAGSVSFGGDHWHRFTYDVQDNIRSWKLAGVKDYATYEYDATNRLTAIRNTGNAVVESFAYDPQGNLSNKTGTAFTFDFGNRNRGMPGVEGFRYDGHGRRVSTWLPMQGKARFYMYGRSGQLLFEGSETQGINSEFVFLGDDLIAARERLSGGVMRTRYKHTDALGSPIATTDEAGAVVSRTNYEPFGKAVAGTVDGIGYTGHVMDSQSGLIYMQQRYYDPAIGRFLSVDPMAAHTTSGWNFNRYNYAANNPFAFTDPDGRVVQDRWRDPMGDRLSKGRFNNPCGQPICLSAGGGGGGEHDPVEDYKNERREMVRRGEETFRAAGRTAAEEAGSMAGGWVLGRILGRVVRYFRSGDDVAKELGEVSFGRSANQLSHTFRHVERAGLDRTSVQRAVQADLRNAASRIENGRPFNQTIDVGGTRVTYTAYRLEDGSINVGRITPD